MVESILGLLTFFAPLALRIIGKKLDNDQASADAVAAYLKVAEAAVPGFTASATLKKSYDDQKTRMDEMERIEQEQKNKSSVSGN